MANQSAYRFAAVLVAIAALFFIFERLWNLALAFQDIILLFALAWLISFTFAPLIEWLKKPYFPETIYQRYRQHIPPLPQRHLFGHGSAVAVIYIAMIALLIIGTGSIVPVAIVQGQNLSQLIPELPTRLPGFISDLQSQMAHFGLNIDLRGFYQTNLEPQLSQLGVTALRELVNSLSIIASTVSNLLFVIILSLYMSLSGRSLTYQFAELIPRQYKKEVTVLAASVNKNFGGFIRGQLIQSLLVGIVTAVVMITLRLDFVVLAAILSGFFMLIPLLGVFLAIIPPLLVAAFSGSLLVILIVFGLLFLFQQVLMNVIMPKILSDSVGLHPLMVFAALLVGVRVGGIWGAFFGIPIAGVLYALLIYFGLRLRRATEERRTEEVGN